VTMVRIALFLFYIISLNTFAYSVDQKAEIPQDLCEAIEYNSIQWFDYYSSREDINSCAISKKLDCSTKIFTGVIGLATGPMAPLIWYSTFRKRPETPLSTAVWYKQLSLVSKLIEKGALVNKQDSMGYTALHWASSALLSQETYYECAEMLLDAEAELSLAIADNDGMTPLHWAVSKRNNIIARLLIARGAPVNAQDNTGKTPLHYAYESANEHIVPLLEKSGAKEIADRAGNYPRDYVCKTAKTKN
jgi:hypothetical protein